MHKAEVHWQHRPSMAAPRFWRGPFRNFARIWTLAGRQLASGASLHRVEVLAAWGAKTNLSMTLPSVNGPEDRNLLQCPPLRISRKQGNSKSVASPILPTASLSPTSLSKGAAARESVLDAFRRNPEVSDSRNSDFQTLSAPSSKDKESDADALKARSMRLWPEPEHLAEPFARSLMMAIPRPSLRAPVPPQYLRA